MDGSRSRHSEHDESVASETYVQHSSVNRRRGRAMKRSAAGKRTRRRRLSGAVETLEKRMLLTFAVDLFADINALGLSSNIGETEFGFDDQPQVVAIGNETFFVAEDGSRGSELWKTDGTAGGTTLVKDITPGPEGSSPDGLTNVGGMLYFTALDEFGETDLWKSDGTEVGTEIVFDADAAGVYGLSSLTESNDKLFFTAYGISGIDLLAPELWVSDGTSAGTVQVIELNENAPDSEGPKYLIDVDDVLYFTSDDDGATDPNRELWKSDGTAAGTVKVSEVDGDPSIGSYPRYLTNANGTLFFAAYGADGDELFRVNNTADGTVLIADLNPTGDSGPRELTAFGSEVFFSATDGTTGRQLYKADTSGVTLVADTTNGLGNSSPIDLEVVGNELFFSANGSVPGATEGTFDPAGRELHKTDGTAGNFTLVADIVPIGSSNPSQLTEVDGKLFFAADDVTGDGLELWAHDPVADTTMLMVDSFTGVNLSGAPNDGAPQLFGALGSQLLFTTTDDTLDRELWTSDGTPAGTVEVLDINPATEDANVTDLIPIGNDIFFVADDGINGEAIWRADTVNETVELFEDITDSSTDEISKLTLFGNQNDRIVFYNNTFGSAGGVFVTDGVNDPALIADFRPVELDEEGTLFVTTETDIFFVAPFNGVNKLFRSDGNATATVVEAGAGQPDYSNPSNLTAYGTSTVDLYFSADGVGIGNELYVTVFQPPQGPGGGSTVVQPLGGNAQNTGNGGADSSFPQELTVSAGTLFFTADTGGGRELYERDGNGVRIVDDLRASGGSDPRNLTDVDGVLYFSANNGSDGFEPYRTTGPGATIQIADINPGSASSHPDEFFSAIGGQVFFAADDGTNGTELWKTNGTQGNATLVADIRPGSGSSDPQLIYDTGTRLIFSAEGSDNDRELWSTDGVSITLQVADINAGDSFGSDPGDIVELDDVLYFPATSNLLGRELYTLEEVDPEVTDVLVGGRVGEPSEEANRSSVDLVTVVFNGRVVVPSTAVELHNLDTGEQVTSLQVNPRYAQGRTFVELTFASGPSVVDRDTSDGLGNALADGNYRLDVLMSQVTSPVSGVDTSMLADFNFGTDAADGFFSMFGDTDGDRDVDAQDLGVFGLSFLQTNAVQRYNEDVDYDGDGDVDSSDMGQFRRRYGKRLNY